MTISTKNPAVSFDKPGAPPLASQSQSDTNMSSHAQLFADQMAGDSEQGETAQLATAAAVPPIVRTLVKGFGILNDIGCGVMNTISSEERDKYNKSLEEREAREAKEREEAYAHDTKNCEYIKDPERYQDCIITANEKTKKRRHEEEAETDKAREDNPWDQHNCPGSNPKEIKSRKPK